MPPQERAFHECFFKGDNQKDKDYAALNEGFLYAIRFEYENKGYSYYAKSLESALQCKSQLKEMKVESSSIVKL